MQDINIQMIESIVKKVIEEQMNQSQKQHRVVDKSGVIGIKAEKIKPEPFDTGKAGDKVFLTDLYSLDESPRLGAGIMEMEDTTFDWTLNYDEVDYVIDGTLEIIIDGRKIVGNKGDIILIPKNTKIQFSTPNFCRFMYVVYPANWAEQA
ncbi:ethanolamine utilization protein [Fusibacter sp. 3D3]|uniref:ethanolamine utilization protein n=1 Tax=Fusibacter sp. 3D3 TaxID=1048380 RepID=UPI00085346C5|nr:ethanolamine utilization protein [Fusibacter sp. 3D3]GAU75879.1 ethanolamine utilization protein EutQ [Fusibacter sp. 3D3]